MRLRFQGRKSFREESWLSRGAVTLRTFSNSKHKNGAEKIVKNEVKATNRGDKNPAAFWRTFGIPHGHGPVSSRY